MVVLIKNCQHISISIKLTNYESLQNSTMGQWTEIGLERERQSAMQRKSTPFGTQHVIALHARTRYILYFFHISNPLTTVSKQVYPHFLKKCGRGFLVTFVLTRFSVDFDENSQEISDDPLNFENYWIFFYIGLIQLLQCLIHSLRCTL